MLPPSGTSETSATPGQVLSHGFASYMRASPKSLWNCQLPVSYTICQSPIPQILLLEHAIFSQNLNLLLLLSSFYQMVAPLSPLPPNLGIVKINLDSSSPLNSTE